jgi:hypothetical protein
LDLELPMQSVPITTNVVSSRPAHDEVYSIQVHMNKWVNYFRQVSGFLRYSVSSANKIDRHDMA